MGAKLISKLGDDKCRELVSDLLQSVSPKKNKSRATIQPRSCSLKDLLINLDTALAKSVLMSVIDRKSSVSQITRAIMVARRKASSLSIGSALSSSSLTSPVSPIASTASFGSAVSVHDVRQLMRQVSSNGSFSKLAPPSRSFNRPPLSSFSSLPSPTTPPITIGSEHSSLSTSSLSSPLPPTPSSSTSDLSELQELLSMKAMTPTDVERSKKLMARLSVKKFKVMQNRKKKKKMSVDK